MESKDNQSPKSNRLRNIGLNIAALLIGFTIFLVIGEVVIRIIYPKGIPEVFPTMFMNDPVAGYRLKPNYEGVHRHRDFIVTYTMNSSGFRDINHPIQKPKGIYRILIIGDSMTFGVGVPMENTYPKVLEKLLNEKDSTKRYEVINAGIPGFGTDQEYNFYVKEGISYQPDLVIVGFLGLNDIDNVETGWQKFSAPNGYIVQAGKKETEPKGGRFIGFITRHSKLALIVNYKFTKLLDAYRHRGQSRELPYQIYQDRYSPSFTNAIEKTKEYLLGMNKITGQNNGQMILLLIPFEMEVSKKNWIKYQLEDLDTDALFDKNLLYPSRKFSQFGKEHQIPTLDLVPIFRADHPENCYFRYEAHINTEGHALIANSLYNFIIQNKVNYLSKN